MHLTLLEKFCKETVVIFKLIKIKSFSFYNVRNIVFRFCKPKQNLFNLLIILYLMLHFYSIEVFFEKKIGNLFANLLLLGGT